MVRSIRRTRGSLRSFMSICPKPVSTAVTCAAPCCSRQSVNPPVEAPTSRQARPVDVDLPVLQSRRELQSAAAHVGLVFAEKADGGIFRDGRARLVDLLLPHQNPAGKNERAGAFAAGGKAALDEQQIEPYFSSFRLSGLVFPVSFFPHSPLPPRSSFQKVEGPFPREGMALRDCLTRSSELRNGLAGCERDQRCDCPAGCRAARSRERGCCNCCCRWCRSAWSCAHPPRCLPPEPWCQPGRSRSGSTR